MPDKTRIEDFGDYIPGARKDPAVQRLDDGLRTDPQFRLALPKSWPAPHWATIAKDHEAAGIPRERLAFMRALRDELRKPDGRFYEHLASTNGRRPGLRASALAVFEGKIGVSEALSRIEEANRFVGVRCHHLTTLYTEIGHLRDLHDFTAVMTSGDWPEEWIVSGRRRPYRVRATGPTLRAAARNLLPKLEEAAAAEEKRANSGSSEYLQRSFIPGALESEDGTKQYGVWRRAPGGSLIRVISCSDMSETQHAVLHRRAEIEEAWRRWKKLPDMRRPENRPRQPPTERGTDNPDIFTARYRFRGVQFGNWVENSRRRRDLIDTSLALDDLALVLDWPVESLPLNGRLALAFGARGMGGRRRARAHYEPLQKVIAISKPTGPGSLAHEWFHALDHKGGLPEDAPPEAAEKSVVFGTEQLTGKSDNPAGAAPPNLQTALTEYGNALHRSGMFGRSKVLDERRSKRSKYWSTTIEMAARAFEAWVVRELRRRGVKNDYLANVKSIDEWKPDSELGHEYPYPTAEELEELAPYISAIADAGRAASRRPTGIDSAAMPELLRATG